MDKKKLIQIIIIFVVALWAFCASLMISSTIAKKAGKDSTTTTYNNTAQSGTQPQPQQSTTNPSTTESKEYIPPVNDITLGNHVVTTVNVGDPDWKVSQDASISASKEHEEINKNVPVGKDNIVKAYVNGINKLKNTEEFTMSTSGTLDISFDQLTGGALAEGTAKDAIAKNAPKTATYNFVKGTDAPSGQTTVTIIPPSGSYAKLSSDAVKQATANPTGDGGYKIVLILKDETQTLTQKAENHSTAIESVNFASYMPNGVALDELSLTYSGATVEAVFDKDNRLISLNYKLPITNGYGSGTYTLLTKIDISLKFHGEQTRSCIFTY